METKTTQENSEVCALCKWTNVGLLNLGEPGSPVMVCHGCCKRMHDTLRKISEPWLQTESAGASFRRRMAADALTGKWNPDAWEPCCKVVNVSALARAVAENSTEATDTQDENNH